MRGLTHTLAFFLEVTMLYTFGLAGYRLGHTEAGSVLLASAFVVAIVALWAIWAAPRSPRRLTGWALLAFKVILFALATALLALFAKPVAAAQFAMICAAYLALALRLKIL